MFTLLQPKGETMLKNDESFSEDLTRLSFESIDRLKGEKLEVENLVLYEENLNPPNLDENLDLASFQVDVEKDILKISPLEEYVQIVAVDVSVRKIGKTRNGVVCAFRGTIVWKDEYAYHYTRYGPFLLYIVNNKNFSCLTFKNENLNHRLGKTQVFMEKIFQNHVFKNLKDSIVLLDGCLLNQNINLKMLDLARKNNNKVLAFAKQSNIYINGKPAIHLLAEKEPPCILHLTKPTTQKPIYQSLGWIFLTKFSHENYGFRVDADQNLSFDEVVNVFRKLLGNEIFIQGYPETLRVAHMLSILTNVEVLAIQRFLSEEYGIKILKSPNTRRMLFGPFGKWVEC